MSASVSAPAVSGVRFGQLVIKKQAYGFGDKTIPRLRDAMMANADFASFVQKAEAEGDDILVDTWASGSPADSCYKAGGAQVRRADEYLAGTGSILDFAWNLDEAGYVETVGRDLASSVMTKIRNK